MRMSWTGPIVGKPSSRFVRTSRYQCSPFFVATVAAKSANYYRLHRKAHLDPEWAREHLPWHYDHHMAPDQECNWGVTNDWVDRLMGTRKVWVGTEGELKQRGKLARLREKRRERKQAA